MNQWDERIRSHRVWHEMETLGPAIDAANSIDGLTPDTLAGIERLRAILTYSGKRLAAADPRITAPQSLESIASYLAAIQNELTTFASDSAPAHVETANQTADTLLPFLSQVPGAYSSEELGALVALSNEYRATVQDALSRAKSSIDNYNSVLDDSLAKIESTSHASLGDLNDQLTATSKGFTTKIESIEASLAALTTAIQAEQQKLAQIISDQQGQFSTAQEGRGKEFTESLRLANENVTKLVTEYQSQFSAAQDTRSKENAAAESARQTKFSETIADYSKKLADQDADFTKQRNAFLTSSERDLAGLVSQFNDKAKEILDDVEEKQKHVEKLVGVIGNLGVTSGYLRVANQARLAMWLWQAATVGSLGTLSFIAYRTLNVLEGQDGHFSWGGFAARALVLVSLGVVAAYSGIQGDRQFGEERRNRKLALELEAIGPYLAPLPEEEQNKFRLQIGERSFGRETEFQMHRKSPTSAVDLVNSKEIKELVKFAVETAVNAVKVKG